MKLPKMANVVDIEHDNGRLIEIGLTTVSLTDRLIVQTYSLPLKPDKEVSPEILELTAQIIGAEQTILRPRHIPLTVYTPEGIIQKTRKYRTMDG